MRKSVPRESLEFGDDEKPYKVVLLLIALSTIATSIGVLLATAFA